MTTQMEISMCLSISLLARGKSAMWDAPLLARKLHGSRNRTTLVISPWESLLAQHKRKSQKFAHGTNLRIHYISSQGMNATLNMLEGFDLLLRFHPCLCKIVEYETRCHSRLEQKSSEDMLYRWMHKKWCQDELCSMLDFTTKHSSVDSETPP